MNLTDEQKQKVTGWLGEGLKLSEVQKRLESEFGLRLTYLEVRMLMADLSLIPKDTERVQPADLSGKNAADPPGRPAPPPAGTSEDWPAGTDADPAAPAGNVSVTVDQVTRPGAMASGKVTFSDGQSAQWYLDQMGRLGLIAAQQGYRPPPADIQEFQMALEGELRRLGM
jgi:hypothetical protein